MVAILLVTRPLTALAADRRAASCSRADVLTAMNAAQAGDNVIVPPCPGGVRWTAGVSWTPPPNVSLIGAGTSVVGGGDQTVIIDAISRNLATCASDSPTLGIDLPATGTFRMSGFTLRGAGGDGSCNGNIRVGSSGSTIRIDHVHIQNVHSNVAVLLSGTYGVVDHFLCDAPGGADNCIRALGVDATYGDPEWAAPTNLGTADGWLYVEDSIFNNGIMNDCFTGGKQVFRYNTGNGTGLQQHGTGHATRNRGCRAMEAYGNSFSSGPSNGYAPESTYGGPSLVWGNTVTGSFAHFLSYHYTRRNHETYNNNGGGWIECGAAFGPSPWDENRDSTGHACMDQGGRGMGDLIVGATPLNQTRGGVVAWPRQAIEPMYEWLNNVSGLTGSYLDNRDALYIENEDFYMRRTGLTHCPANAASCAQGVGVGTRAQRPLGCAAGPGGNTPGVAWWSTDQGGNWNTVSGGANDGCLDLCTATDTWTDCSYTPLTYPHPLVRGGAPTDAGMPPDSSAPPPSDAGFAPDDAGFAPEDAGLAPDDVGLAPDDAGLSPDAGGHPDGAMDVADSGDAPEAGPADAAPTDTDASSTPDLGVETRDSGAGGDVDPGAARDAAVGTDAREVGMSGRATGGCGCESTAPARSIASFALVVVPALLGRARRRSSAPRAGRTSGEGRTRAVESVGMRLFAVALMSLLAASACVSQVSGPDEDEAEGAAAGSSDHRYGFGCLDEACVWIDVAGIAERQLVAVTRSPRGIILGTYSATVAFSAVAFRPRTSFERFLTRAPQGLDVEIQALDGSRRLRLPIRRVLTDVRDRGRSLVLELNRSPDFSSAAYRLGFTDALTGAAHQISVPRTESNELEIDLDANPSLATALADHGATLTIVNAAGRRLPGSYRVALGSAGWLTNFYRGTQLQGHLPGMGLITIPDYLTPTDPTPQMLVYPKKKSQVEIPFVDSFTINRFLGGYRKRWLEQSAGSFPQVESFVSSFNVAHGLPDTIEHDALDYVRSVRGQLVFQPDLIRLHLEPYLAAGYRLGDITLGVENIPWALARLNPDGTNPEASYGQRNPFQSEADWRSFLDTFLSDLRATSASFATEYRDGTLPSFKTGGEFMSTSTFNGTRDEFFSYYRSTAEAVATRFPGSRMSPGEFVGVGSCPGCVYELGDFVQTFTQTPGQSVRVSSLPRSLHAVFDRGAAKIIAPSNIANRAVRSYAAFPQIEREIFQFGLLGLPIAPPDAIGSPAELVDPTTSDIGAISANWEFQTLMRLKHDLDPRRVFHWGTFAEVSGRRDGSLVNLRILNGSGYVRLLLDRYRDSPMYLLDTRAVRGSTTAEVLGVAFVRQASTAFVVSNFESAADGREMLVELTVPSSLLKGRTPASWRRVRYRVSDNVFMSIRTDLEHRGWLDPRFRDCGTCVASPQSMASASHVGDAVGMVIDGWASTYLPKLEESLRLSRVNPDGSALTLESHRLEWSPGSNRIRVLLEPNELLVLE